MPTHPRLSQELDAALDGSRHGGEHLGGGAAALAAAVAEVRDLAAPTSIFQTEVRAIWDAGARDQQPRRLPWPLCRGWRRRGAGHTAAGRLGPAKRALCV